MTFSVFLGILDVFSQVIPFIHHKNLIQWKLHSLSTTIDSNVKRLSTKIHSNGRVISGRNSPLKKYGKQTYIGINFTVELKINVPTFTSFWRLHTIACFSPSKAIIFLIHSAPTNEIRVCMWLLEFISCNTKQGNLGEEREVWTSSWVWLCFCFSPFSIGITISISISMTPCH